MSYNVTVSGNDYEGVSAVKLKITGEHTYKTFGDVDGLVDGTIAAFENDTATIIKKYAFMNCKSLTVAKCTTAKCIELGAFDSCNALSVIDFPNVEQIQNTAFYGCSNISGELVFPKICNPIGSNAFTNCAKITKIVLPVVRGTNARAFNGCSGLKVLDLGSVIGKTTITTDKIVNAAFEGLTNLEALIIRTTSNVVPLDTTNAFYTTPIADGAASDTCFIYVPSALVDSYKADAVWSTFANQIRAIEDYPDICG